MVQSSSVTPASMVRAIWEGTGGQPLQKARPSPRSLAVQLPTSTTRPPRQSSSVASPPKISVASGPFSYS